MSDERARVFVDVIGFLARGERVDTTWRARRALIDSGWTPPKDLA